MPSAKKRGAPQPPAQAQEDSSICHHCGAPFVPGRAECNYCRAAYPNVHVGPRCPRCHTLNTHESPQCAQCQGSLAQGCVFCGGASPLDTAACMHCGEAFAGSQDRKRLRDAQQERAQYLSMAQAGVGVVGAVAASGAGAGLFDSVSNLVGELLNGDGN